MKSQLVLDAIAGDTVGIWKVSHVTSEPGVSPVTLADLSAGYTCSIRAIYDSDGTEAVAERAVTDLSGDNLYFLAALLPSETDGLTPGEITVAVQLTNLSLSPPLRKEKQYTVRIYPSVAANT